MNCLPEFVRFCILHISLLPIISINCEEMSDKVDNLTFHPGHLKPFGSQGTKLPIETLDYFPSPTQFFTNYVNTSKPLLIRGGARVSPAFELWSDEYFLALPEAEDNLVVVETAKKENRSLSPEDFTLSEFVRRYKNEDIYLVHSVPDFIGKDVYLPPCLLCPTVFDYLLEKLMWFSSGGTKSVLHYDSAENINCLFSGEKIFYMVDYKDADKVVIENKKSAYSDVDVESVDLLKYPGLKDVSFHYVKMQAGDCLYIPYHWFHHVLSHGRNLAVNVWWSASAQPYLPNCNLPNMTIDEMKFSGFKDLHPRETIDGMRDALKLMFDEYDEDVTFDQFKHFMTTNSFIFESDAEWTVEMREILKQIFIQLNKPSQDNQLTKEDVEKTTDKTWNEIVEMIKKLTYMVEGQFEQDGEESNDFEPEDSIVFEQHEKNEL